MSTSLDSNPIKKTYAHVVVECGDAVIRSSIQEGGAAELNVSNTVFLDKVKLKVTNGYRGMTFAQELSEQNQKNAASTQLGSLIESPFVALFDTNSEHQKNGAPGGPCFG